MRYLIALKAGKIDSFNPAIHSQKSVIRRAANCRAIVKQNFDDLLVDRGAAAVSIGLIFAIERQHAPFGANEIADRDSALVGQN